MNQSNKKIRFKTLSEQAATAENQGKYAEAAELWNKARRDASSINKEWCDHRCSFCERVAIRPFGKEQ